jgi:hypothetical protein
VDDRYHQGPQVYDSGSGWRVELVGHGEGVKYVEGDRWLLWYAEFLALPTDRSVGVWRREVSVWDPPNNSVSIGPEQQQIIERRLFEGLRAMGHEPEW